MLSRKIRWTWLVLAVVTVPLCASAQLEDVQIEAERVAEGIYVLTGRGGNIGASVGEDAVFLIDDQFAPLTEKIKAAVAELSDAPVRFVLNTHYHGDHTGGNENFGEAGAVIVAHENVRKRLSTEWVWEIESMGRDEKKPQPEGAWPVVTFTRDMTFHLNGETTHIFHVAHAHTDGDAIVHFERTNVFHMGDVFFNGLYPFVDTSGGGTFEGLILAVDLILEMADDQSRVIPGHGAVTDKAGLQAYRDMLVVIRDRIAEHLAKGHSVEEVLAARPTQEYDADWGGSNFMPPERFVRIIYDDMARE